MNLKKKVVLITGGSSGVGYKIAETFVSEKAVVIIIGRNEDNLKHACEVLGENARYFAVDVADRKGVLEMVEWAIQKNGQIDILINNAGINTFKRTMDILSPEDWDYVLNVNTTGAFNLIHSVLPHMRKRKQGLIISISSIAGSSILPPAGAAYSASKYSLTVLTKIVAAEEMQNNIRATVISPGRINTPYLDRIPETFTDEYRLNILQPEDVASVVLFIAKLPKRVHIPEIFMVSSEDKWIH